MVHLSVRAMTAQFQVNSQPDLSALSAFAYIDCNPIRSLTLASINTALAYSDAPGTATKPAMCTFARDTVAQAIRSNVPVTDVKSTAAAMARASIMKAFFEGPRDVAASFIRQRLREEYGVGLTVTDDAIIANWFNFAKEQLLKNELKMLQNTPDAEDTVNYKAWSDLETNYSEWLQYITLSASTYLRIDQIPAGDSLSQAATHSSEVISTLTMSLSQGMIDTIVNFVFRPWLTLFFIEQFATNKAFSIHTQVYAYKLFADVASRAVTMIASTYSPSDPGLTNIASAIGALLPTELNDVDNWALQVVKRSSDNRKATIALQAVNATAGLRLQRSNDLQIRFQVLEGQVIKQKQLMLVWIVALIAVLGASTFLVISDHMSAFMLLVFGTVGILICVVAVPALYNYFKRKSNML